MRKSTRGFTIVELLIVIVVIAILAAISVVAYTGIQERARRSHLLSDITVIKKAMEIYKVSYNDYPYCPSGAECSYNANIRPQLEEFTKSLPAVGFAYIHDSAQPTRWGMRYAADDAPYKLSTTCKFGLNMYSTWYSNAPECGV